jgi:hypothetical protein
MRPDVSALPLRRHQADGTERQLDGGYGVHQHPGVERHHLIAGTA